MTLHRVPRGQRPLPRLLASVGIAGCLALVVGPGARAQVDRTADAPRTAADTAPAAESSRRSRWPVFAGGVAIAAIGDERISAFARSHQSAALDRVATSLDPLGRAGTLVPTLVGAALLTRVAAPRTLADATLRTGLAYAAADGVESILKPLIGRHRPTDAGSAWRFSPFSNDGDWHSTPSAHTVHAFSVATAIAIESRSTWAAAPAYVLASLVGTQRVYTSQHWASDVVGSAILSGVVARWTENRLRSRGIPHLLRPADTTAP